MDWHKLVSLAVGESVPGRLADVLGSERAIIELSETIRPRRVLVAQHPDGSNLMVTVLHDTERDTYTLRGRYRYPSGLKEEAPPVKWLPAEEGDVPRALQGIVASAEKLGREHGGTVTNLTFPPGASIEEIVAIFAQSGAFNILRDDEGEIRKVA